MYCAFLLALAAGVYASVCVQFLEAKVFNPIEYGAKGDGVTYDTAAIRAALAAAEAENGGEILFEAHHQFLTGCFNVSNNVILNIKGTILASQLDTDYTKTQLWAWGWSHAFEFQALIQTYFVSNITITGGGTIDGQGAPWYNCPHNNCTGYDQGWDRPDVICMVQTNNIKIENIKIKDAPIAHIKLSFCNNIHIDNVFLNSACTSPNTDGIDVQCCQNVLIENSGYTGGDDAIAVSAGGDRGGLEYGRITENVFVRNFTVGNSDGLSIGSGTSAGVRNVTFTNCSFDGAAHGEAPAIHLKSYRGNGGTVEDITYSDIRINNAKVAMGFDMHFHGTAIPPTNNSYTTPKFKNIYISNVYSDNALKGWKFEGLPESIITNVQLRNIKLVNTHNLNAACVYTRGTCENVEPECPPCFNND